MWDRMTLSGYYESIAHVDYFYNFALLVGAILAWAILRYVTNSGPRREMLLPIWVIVAGAVLMRLPLFNQAFWYDETFTASIIQTDSIASMMTAIRGDVHPPGYYLIVRAFTEFFGSSSFVMRLPALISGIALIPVMYTIAKHHNNVQVARWTALLTAILPAATYYSVEARYPATLALFLGLSYIGIAQRRPWLFSFCLLIAGGLHINAYFYVVIMCALWLLIDGRWLYAAMGSLSMLHWLPIALEQSGDVTNGFWLPLYSATRHIVEMTINARFDSAEIALIPLIISMSILYIAIYKYRARASWLWLAMLVLPPLAQWVASALLFPVYLPRTLLISSLFLIIPVADYIYRGGNRWLLGAGAAAIIAAHGGLHTMPRDVGTSAIVSECANADSIYATNTHTAIFSQHFAHAPVMAFIQGNSTAQELPLDARQALFDVGNIFTDLSGHVCVIAQMNPFNTDTEIMHLEKIAAQLAEDVRFYNLGDELSQYLIMDVYLP